MAEDGLITIASAHPFDETVSRFEAALTARGVSLFARVDHAAGAAAAGMTLRPTILLIFGNARAGTPLMQANQQIGVDLPLKALVWQGEDSKVWLTYSDPAWLAARHQLASATSDAVAALGKGLAAMAKEATDA